MMSNSLSLPLSLLPWTLKRQRNSRKRERERGKKSRANPENEKKKTREGENKYTDILILSPALGNGYHRIRLPHYSEEDADSEDISGPFQTSPGSWVSVNTM